MTAAVAVAALYPAGSAHALCMYGQTLYARTTLSQEFHDARLVVLARVSSKRNLWNLDPEGAWGTVYRLAVVRTFKGRTGSIVRDFSERDSGGFYLDVGREYLLFLNPIEGSGWGKAAPGAWMVNYNCGQSRPWTQVPEADRQLLAALAAK